MSGEVTHQLNCALLIPVVGGVKDGNDRKCSCGAARPVDANPQNLIAQRPRSLDDVSGEEWNAASRAYREKIASPKFTKVAPGSHDEPAEAPSVAPESLGATLTRWWVEKAQEEAEELVPKAVEYGGAHRASDLTQLGRTIAELTGWTPDEVRLRGLDTEDYHQELACYFYIQGKMGRWHAALLEGRKVSDDTIHDIKIYTTMVQRIRAAGGWPV